MGITGQHQLVASHCFLSSGHRVHEAMEDPGVEKFGPTGEVRLTCSLLTLQQGVHLEQQRFLILGQPRVLEITHYTG